MDAFLSLTTTLWPGLCAAAMLTVAAYALTKRSEETEARPSGLTRLPRPVQPSAPSIHMPEVVAPRLALAVSADTEVPEFTTLPTTPPARRSRSSSSDAALAATRSGASPRSASLALDAVVRWL